MVITEKRPENITTEIYFALCAGLVMLAFVGSIAYVETSAEVMSYSLLYLLLLTFLFAIYKIVLWKRYRHAQDDED